MNDFQKLTKPRTPKRFYFITALIYLPAFLSLSMVRAYWYGWLWVGLSFVLLLWIRSSLMWHGLRMTLCFVLAFFVALSGLHVSRPQKNVSLIGQIGRETLRFFTNLPLGESVLSGAALSEIRNWKPPVGYNFEIVTLSHSQLELLSPEENQSDRVVLQLHGGAFMAGLNDLYRVFSKRYSDLTQRGMVATLDYRLWPEHGYPAQQDDAMEAWQYLTEVLSIQPENIVIAGDSAGGNLALSLCLRLRDEGKPLPGALVCMSAWADLSNSGPSHLYNATLDPTFGVDAETYDGHPVGVDSAYADALNVKDPYISPSFGDYHGFPRMLLQAAKNEVLLSDSEMVYENAKSYGVDCTLTVYENLFHVFQVTLDLVPESKEAWDEIAIFLEESKPSKAF